MTSKQLHTGIQAKGSVCMICEKVKAHLGVDLRFSSVTYGELVYYEDWK